MELVLNIENYKDENAKLVVSKEKNKISFKDDETVENVLTCLKDLFLCEHRNFVENKSISETVLYLKNLPKTVVCEVFREALRNEDIVNPTIVLNLINLLKGYNSLDKSFFESELVFVNSVMDLIDIRNELKEDIEEFSKKVALWYLSLFVNAHKGSDSTVVMFEKVETMPPIINCFILGTDFVTMSSVISKTKDFNIKDAKIVNNAIGYIVELSRRMITTDSLMSSLLNDLINTAEKPEEK